MDSSHPVVNSHVIGSLWDGSNFDPAQRRRFPRLQPHSDLTEINTHQVEGLRRGSMRLYVCRSSRRVLNTIALSTLLGLGYAQGCADVPQESARATLFPESRRAVLLPHSASDDSDR